MEPKSTTHIDYPERVLARLHTHGEVCLAERVDHVGQDPVGVLGGHVVIAGVALVEVLDHGDQAIVFLQDRQSAGILLGIRKCTNDIL